MYILGFNNSNEFICWVEPWTLFWKYAPCSSFLIRMLLSDMLRNCWSFFVFWHSSECGGRTVLLPQTGVNASGSIWTATSTSDGEVRPMMTTHRIAHPDIIIFRARTQRSGALTCKAKNRHRTISSRMFIHSFIHSGYFYSTSSSPCTTILGGATIQHWHYVGVNTPKRYRQLKVMDLYSCTRSLRGTWSGIRTCYPKHARQRTYRWATTPHNVTI